jgi:hypothetical protein
MIGFSKWLMKRAVHSSPVTEVLPLVHYWYRVSGNEPDMVSLGFRICPLPRLGKEIEELEGVANKDTPSEPPEDLDSADPAILEAALAIRHLENMANVVDADAVLKSDRRLRDKTVEQCRKLLVEAHYDGDAYMNWIGAQE